MFTETTEILWEKRLVVISGEVWSVSKVETSTPLPAERFKVCRGEGWGTWNRMKQTQEIIQTGSKTQSNETGGNTLNRKKGDISTQETRKQARQSSVSTDPLCSVVIRK